VNMIMQATKISFRADEQMMMGLHHWKKVQVNFKRYYVPYT